jgi:ribosomal protein S18 acetylase RimI-like enzyme
LRGVLRCVVEFSIRRAVSEDSPRLWALNQLPNVGLTSDPDLPLDLPGPTEAPPSFPDLADVTASFLADGGEFLVAEMRGSLVGMAGFKPDDGGAAVLRVRVHPAVRRAGIGRALMDELERRARQAGITRLHLDTADNQPEALAFYAGIGYEEIARESRPDWSWTLVYFEKRW